VGMPLKNIEMNMVNKSKRQLELAASFWIGIGLMSIINVWKITGNEHALTYSWIMFGISIIFIILCVILIKIKK
jgi:hypothetical protein